MRKVLNTCPRTALFGSLAIILSTTFCAVTLEMALRLGKPQPTYSSLLKFLPDQYQPGDFNSFTLKPSYDSAIPYQDDHSRLAKIHVNALGMRGPETTQKKPPGIKRILVLGDSYTFGVYVDDEESYPRMLERLFRDEYRQVEVLNAGYADGFDPDEHYAWLLHKGLSFKPDLIIYGFFVGNDPDSLNEARWAKLDENGLPSSVIDKELWIDQFGRLRMRSEDAKTVGNDWIYRVPFLRESHLAIWLARHKTLLVSGNLPKWGEAPPFPFILQAHNDAKMQHQQELWLKLVKGFASIAKKNGARFELLMIPVNFQVEPQFLPQVMGSEAAHVERNFFEEVKPALKKASIPYVDLMSMMQQHPEQKYFPRDGEVHFNANGHAFAARALKQAIDQEHLLE